MNPATFWPPLLSLTLLFHLLASPPALAQGSTGSRPGTLQPRFVPGEGLAAPAAELREAQHLLQAGQWQAAALPLERLLRRQPRQLDALRWLAVIRQHAGQTDDAEALRREALRIAPGDPGSLAAFHGGGHARNDPRLHESRLRHHLSQHPASAELHFALGNLLAMQARWDEARPAYQQACQLDPGNPDHLFNLAIAFDRMGQIPQAIELYQQAREAARQRTASYPQDEARRRIAELASIGKQP